MCTKAEVPYYFAAWLLVEKRAMPEAAAVIEEMRCTRPGAADLARVDALAALWIDCHAAVSAEWQRRLRREPRGKDMSDKAYEVAVGNLIATIVEDMALTPASKQAALEEFGRRFVDGALRNITVTLGSNGGDENAH
jgi:hypothetical protein